MKKITALLYLSVVLLIANTATAQRLTLQQVKNLWYPRYVPDSVGIDSTMNALWYNNGGGGGGSFVAFPPPGYIPYGGTSDSMSYEKYGSFTYTPYYAPIPNFNVAFPIDTSDTYIYMAGGAQAGITMGTGGPRLGSYNTVLALVDSSGSKLYASNQWQFVYPSSFPNAKVTWNFPTTQGMQGEILTMGNPPQTTWTDCIPLCHLTGKYEGDYTLGTGAGAGASIDTLNITDIGGTIVLTTAGTPAINSPIVSIIYHSPFSSYSSPVFSVEHGTTVSTGVTTLAISGSTTRCTLWSGVTALSTGDVLKVNFVITGQ